MMTRVYILCPERQYELLNKNFADFIYSNVGAGQQCCYNAKGNLMVGGPNGGSLHRVHVEAGVPVFSHFLHDLVPYWDCCQLSKNCRKYFEKRPSDDGSRYVPVRPGEIPVLINDDKGADNNDGLNLMLENYRYFKLAESSLQCYAPYRQKKCLKLSLQFSPFY